MEMEKSGGDDDDDSRCFDADEESLLKHLENLKDGNGLIQLHRIDYSNPYECIGAYSCLNEFLYDFLDKIRPIIWNTFENRACIEKSKDASRKIKNILLLAFPEVERNIYNYCSSDLIKGQHSKILINKLGEENYKKLEEMKAKNNVIKNKLNRRFAKFLDDIYGKDLEAFAGLKNMPPDLMDLTAFKSVLDKLPTSST
jgi:hypothetical protein